MRDGLMGVSSRMRVRSACASSARHRPTRMSARGAAIAGMDLSRYAMLPIWHTHSTGRVSMRCCTGRWVRDESPRPPACRVPPLARRAVQRRMRVVGVSDRGRGQGQVRLCLRRPPRLRPRRAERGWAMSAGMGLAELRARSAPGTCPFCGESRAKYRGRGRYPLTCGAPECRTAYHRCWRRDARAALRATEATLRRLEATP